MRRHLVLLASGVPILLFGCGEVAEVTASKGRPVSLTSVEAVDLEDRIEATGELLAKEQTVVAAEVAGRISGISIDEGQAAQSGEAVLTIDPERRSLERDRAQAQVEDARAAQRDREREYQRVVELHQRNVASETQLEQAKTELDRSGSKVLAAEADLGVAARALADARVKAPFSGLVARRLVGFGQYVSPGTPLFELVALDPIEVQFYLPEVDSARVKMGHMVGVRVSPYPDEVFQAWVVVVSPTIDSRTRTLRVKAEFDNSDGRLRPGLFARVDLGISTRRGRSDDSRGGGAAARRWRGGIPPGRG